MGIPFLLDPVSEGGLGMTTEQIGFTQGTVGIIGLTIGGILGGIAVSRHGLKHWLWPMVWAISLPDLVYVYLSYFPETSLLWVNVCIFVEQFGYGFGFTAYMMYLIYFSRGTHSTAHYAICTATLCHLYGVYGVRHDASGYGGGLASGAVGLSAVLYLDYGMLCGYFCCHGIAEDRPGVWEEMNCFTTENTEVHSVFLIKLFFFCATLCSLW